MPRYAPTEQDVYETTPCPVCGLDVIDPERETCSYMCDSFWQTFKDDMERELVHDLMNDVEGE
jgi:hypothetical protein